MNNDRLLKSVETTTSAMFAVMNKNMPHFLDMHEAISFSSSVGITLATSALVTCIYNSKSNAENTAEFIEAFLAAVRKGVHKGLADLDKGDDFEIVGIPMGGNNDFSKT